MRRLPVLFGLVTLTAALLVSVGGTQDKKDKDDPKKTKEDTKKAKGMLPAGFKDLGLSADQKSKIYSIQAEYKTKIVELQKKLKELQTAESKDVFKVLTDEQRDQYLKAKGVETKDKGKDKPGDKGKPKEKDKD